MIIDSTLLLIITTLVFGGLAIFLAIKIWIAVSIKKYYASEEFKKLKNETSNYVRECNELNKHIEILRCKHQLVNNTNQSVAKTIDTSEWNYSRPNIKNYTNAKNVYYCSATVLKNAREQPFKYICKYFGVEADEETLTKFEDMLNDFSAVEQGISILSDRREELLEAHRSEIPSVVLRHDSIEHIEEMIGFDDVRLNKNMYPSYKFEYISAGGNSSQVCNIKFDISTISEFITYLSDKVKFKKSAKGQRQLMTPKLRERIKKRDNYTCCKCGISLNQEPHLLLEIDHIIPIAKGGMTTEDNLQTLCWKCNRTKGTK